MIASKKLSRKFEHAQTRCLGNWITKTELVAVELAVERVSIECRKTKTKVIALANQKGRRQSGKPIKTQSNYT